MDNLLQFEAEIPFDQVLIMEELVGDLTYSLSWNEKGVLIGILPEEHKEELDSRVELPLKWSSLQQVDWLEEDEKQLQPIEVGCFFLYTPYYEGNLPEGKVPLKLHSSHAFGSGHHPTTEGCLQAIQGLKSVRNALDVGCGSGILGMAVHALFDAKVLAFDIDPASVEMAKDNVGDRVEVIQSDGFSHPQIQKEAPYDLIMANIHSDPLSMMAPQVKQAVSKGGKVILSGLLDTQKEEILRVYSALGLTLVQTFGSKEWPTLVLEN